LARGRRPSAALTALFPSASGSCSSLTSIPRPLDALIRCGLVGPRLMFPCCVTSLTPSALP